MTKLPESFMTVTEAAEIVCDAAEQFGNMIDGTDEDCRLFDAIEIVRTVSRPYRPRWWRR